MARFSFLFFFFNDTATTEIYTLSLHDALPISADVAVEIVETPERPAEWPTPPAARADAVVLYFHGGRSEEHTSELQSRLHLVCRLLLAKKKYLNLASTPPHKHYSFTSLHVITP